MFWKNGLKILFYRTIISYRIDIYKNLHHYTAFDWIEEMTSLLRHIVFSYFVWALERHHLG